MKITIKIILLLITCTGYGQITSIGKYAPTGNIKTNSITLSKAQNRSNVTSGRVPLIEIPAPSGNTLKAYIHKSSENTFAYPIPVSIDVIKQAKKETRVDVNVYTLGLKVKDASSLNILFTQFELPAGAELYIYNEDMSDVLGAITNQNNFENKKLPIRPFGSETIYIQYFEPIGNNTTDTKLTIGKVNYGYLSTAFFWSRYGESWGKNIDINCADGLNWQNEKKSVCLVVTGTGLCSGALVNNTRNNGTPYLLTAEHCFSSSNGDTPEEALFIFDYESPYCKGPDGNFTKSIAGSIIKATDESLDLMLLQLNSTIPISYKPFYAGINAINYSQVIRHNATSIHHPKGDVKKISIDEQNMGTLGFSEDPVQNMYWDLYFTKGASQPGSSGCPLFDRTKKIIGVLMAGDHTLLVGDFVRMDVLWDFYTEPNRQLKHWLDPDNTGVRVIPAYTPENSLCLGMMTTSDTVGIYQTATYYNSSFGQGTNFHWYFEGGTPSTATGVGPHTIQYNTTGDRGVTLYGTNAQGVEKVLYERGYINVKYLTPITDFTITRTTINEGDTITVRDNNSQNYPTAYNWEFGTGSDPASITGKGPHIIRFNTAGNKYVRLTTSNPGGSHPVTKYITVNYLKPIVNFTSDRTSAVVNNSNIVFTANCQHTISNYSWDFGDGATPRYSSSIGNIPVTVNYSTEGYKTIKLVAQNPAGKDSLIKVNFIHIYPTPPFANFTLSSNNITEQSSITITENASSNSDLLEWDFGTGAEPRTAIGEGPFVVKYTIPGFAYVKLKAINDAAADSITKTVTVNYFLPVADFSVNNTTPRKFDTITFIDNSQNTINTYTWNFGGTAYPTTASGKGPHKVIYSTVGDKTVQLTVTNYGGSDVEQKVGYIHVGYALPDATISANPRSTTKGGIVVFNATGLNDATGYLWNFGAGANPQTSTAQNSIQVTYSSIGSKTVTLTVTGPGGTKLITLSNYITVSDAKPVADFTVNNPTPYENESIVFTSTCQNNPSEFAWNFGSGADPSSAIGIGPHSVTYSTSGYKTISLTATNASGSDLESKNSLVIVKILPPIAGINVSDSAEENKVVIVTANCQGTISNYSWNFGVGADPASASGTGPHAIYYRTTGKKTIKLITVNSSGSDTAISDIQVKYSKPVADFNVDQTFITPGMNVVYTANCTNSISNYIWFFGGGCQPTSATGVGPHTVKYNAMGVFDAKLSVTNPAGKDSITKVDLITAYLVPPVSDFWAIEKSVTYYDTVHFYDQSRGPVETYQWNFGVGAVPATANGIGPHSVIYTKKGHKDVKLTVSNAVASDSMLREYYIWVDPYPVVAGFDIISPTIIDNLYYTFDTLFIEDKSKNEPFYYSWDFGAEASPSTSEIMGSLKVVYDTPGTYTITQQVQNEISIDIIEKTIDVLYKKPTGIDYYSIGDFVLYPNPVKDYLHITSEHNKSIEEVLIYDITGSLLLIQQTGKNSIDLRGLDAGIFIIKIGNQTGRIIKQ